MAQVPHRRPGHRRIRRSLTGGGWRAVTKAGASSGPGCMNYENDMPPYIQDIADWLDDDTSPSLQLRQCLRGL